MMLSNGKVVRNVPDKLTDNEITIKALKELLEVMLCEGDLQRTSTISHTIDLINRLQARVEKCEKVERFADKTIATLQAENERLKEELAISHTGYVSMEGKAWELREQLKTAKAEAYKECIEKVKEISNKMELVCSGALVRTDYTITEEKLDNLLKELVGEQPTPNNVKCIDCEYLEFKTPYGVCGKAYKGIVSPNDSCGKGKLEKGDKK